MHRLAENVFAPFSHKHEDVSIGLEAPTRGLLRGMNRAIHQLQIAVWLASPGIRSQLLHTPQRANNDAQFGVQTSARLNQQQLVVQLDHISGSKEYAI